eukprot:GHVR01078773.1.p1 GENE.GHVR01078773.1~~GHVR01078773.1.p1  ORF type:complete len:212 (+),score=94.66 GHVR01078773.1:62-697(+)
MGLTLTHTHTHTHTHNYLSGNNYFSLAYFKLILKRILNKLRKINRKWRRFLTVLPYRINAFIERIPDNYLLAHRHICKGQAVYGETLASMAVHPLEVEVLNKACQPQLFHFDNNINKNNINNINNTQPQSQPQSPSKQNIFNNNNCENNNNDDDEDVDEVCPSFCNLDEFITLRQGENTITISPTSSMNPTLVEDNTHTHTHTHTQFPRRI